MTKRRRNNSTDPQYRTPNFFRRLQKFTIPKRKATTKKHAKQR